jgi:hypothetical protein
VAKKTAPTAPQTEELFALNYDNDALALAERDPALKFTATIWAAEWRGGPVHMYGGTVACKPYKDYMQELRAALDQCAQYARGIGYVEQFVWDDNAQHRRRIFDLTVDQLLGLKFPRALLDAGEIANHIGVFRPLQLRESWDFATEQRMLIAIPSDVIHGIEGISETYAIRHRRQKCGQCARGLDHFAAMAGEVDCDRCTYVLALLSIADQTGN